MQQLTITKIYRSDKDKEGKPLIGKNSGKPYTKISIKAQEYGDRWIGGFGNAENRNWQEGDMVTLKVVENGQYLNFEKVSELEIVMEKIKVMDTKLDKILTGFTTSDSFEFPVQAENKTEEEVAVEDIPF